MNLHTKDELPSFFKSKDENKLDLGYENLQDFFVSWTLRCAEESMKSVDPLIQKYSKRILLKLLFDDPELDYKVKEVKAWRQVNQIDLLLEVFLLDKSNNEVKYVVVIENKWYTNVSKNQLVKYSNYINSKYNNTDFQIKKIVLYCDSEKIKLPENVRLTEESDFKATTIEHLKETLDELKTGNYMFDEYWFNFY